MPPPEFPVKRFPAAYRDMIIQVAETTQTDVAMPGAVTLGILAASVAGTAEVTVKRGWTETLCLYLATSAESGERKSPVLALLEKPLLDAEKQLATIALARHIEEEALARIAKSEAERAIREAINESNAKKAEAISAHKKAEELLTSLTPITRLVADDATPEATAQLLAQQGGRLAVLSSEGGIFETMGGRYSAGIANLDVYLKAYSGDPIRIDRKSSPEPFFIDRPTLTLCLMVQPVVLESLGTHRVFRGRGLLARFLYAAPTSRVGYRRVGADPISETVEAAYAAAIHELVTGLVSYGDVADLRLTPDALARIVDLEADVEVQLRRDVLDDDGALHHGDLAELRDWGSKYVGQVIRIAGLLHLAAHGSDGRRNTHPITLDTFDAAVEVGDYFRTNAINAFATMAMSPATSDALHIRDRMIRTWGKAPADDFVVSERQLLRLVHSNRFQTMADLRPGLNRLVDAGWLIADPGDPTTEKKPGRPPSPVYAVHPQLWVEGRADR